MAPLRVGILGCANISKKTAIAISNEESGCTVSTVASRDMDKARLFVDEMFSKDDGDKVACLGGSNAYDELISSLDVDAVYIPLPTVLHKLWATKALEAGKHVLIEKPAATSAAEYRDLLILACRLGLYVQDGTMFLHHPRTSKFLDCVADEDVMGGPVHSVHASWTFPMPEDELGINIRTRKDCDPLGCLGDLGWYCVRMGLLVFGRMGIRKVGFVQALDWKLTDGTVPVEAACLVRFEQGRDLWFHCGFTSAFRAYLDVRSRHCWASMDDFVLHKEPPLEFEINSMGTIDKYHLLTRRNKTVIQVEDGPVQEVCLWKNFARIVEGVSNACVADAGEKEEDLESPIGWRGDSNEVDEANNMAAVSLQTQQIMDALMESILSDGTRVKLP